jgi:AraC-like DNA-binding protein
VTPHLLWVQRGRVHLKQPAGWAWVPSGCAAVWTGEAEVEPSPRSTSGRRALGSPRRPGGPPRVYPLPPLLYAALTEAEPVAALLEEALRAALPTWRPLPLDLPLGQSPALRQTLLRALDRPGDTLAEVAAQGGFCTGTLQRSLEQEGHLGWRAWRQRARLHQALPSVEDPSRPWAAVAADAALRPRALSDLFQEQLGLSALAWRRGQRPVFLLSD